MVSGEKDVGIVTAPVTRIASSSIARVRFIILGLVFIPIWNSTRFAYRPPLRDPKLGHYRMMVDIVMLMFIGFNRI